MRKKRIYTDHMRERNRLYRLKHLEEIKAKQKAYRLANLEKMRANNRAYGLKHREVINERAKLWYKNNKERKIAYNYEWQIRKLETDIQFKLARLLRSRMKHALRGGAKSGSGIRDLGCSSEDLVKHIESQFTGEMSWQNFGLHGWHIDHIKPLRKFDLTDRKQFLEACHYTNLQPLWAFDNLSKGAKYHAI